MVSVPFPHTALISRPREQEVQMNFNGLDAVLGKLQCSCRIVMQQELAFASV